MLACKLNFDKIRLQTKNIFYAIVFDQKFGITFSRLFTPDNYNIMNELKTVKEAVWDLGLDLPCTVQDNLQTQGKS